MASRITGILCVSNLVLYTKFTLKTGRTKRAYVSVATRFVMWGYFLNVQILSWHQLQVKNNYLLIVFMYIFACAEANTDHVHVEQHHNYL